MEKKSIVVCVCLILAVLSVLVHTAVPFGAREEAVQWTAGKIREGTWRLSGEEYLGLFSDPSGKGQIAAAYYSPVNQRGFLPDYLPFHAALLAMASKIGAARLTGVFYLFFMLLCLLRLTRIVLKNTSPSLILMLVFFSPALWVALYRHASSQMLLAALVTGIWTCCFSAEEKGPLRQKMVFIMAAGLLAGAAVLIDGRYLLIFGLMMLFLLIRSFFLKSGIRIVISLVAFLIAGFIAVSPLFWYASNITGTDFVLSVLKKDVLELKGLPFLSQGEQEGICLDRFPRGTDFQCASQRIDPETSLAAPLLLKGWSVPEGTVSGEEGFVWCQGMESAISLYLPRKRQAVLRLRLLPFTYPGAPPQTVDLFMGKASLGRLELEDGWQSYDIPIPANAVLDFPAVLMFKWSRAVSPREAGLSRKDARPLTAAVDYLSVMHPMEDPVIQSLHFFTINEATIHRQKKRGFLQPAGSVLSVPVRIPAGQKPTLHGFLGVIAGDKKGHPPAPVRCRIFARLKDLEDQAPLLDKIFDPAESPYDRFWFPFSVGLTRFEGQDIQLCFQVTALAGDAPSWRVIWAQPCILHNPLPAGKDLNNNVPAKKVLMTNLLTHPQRLLLGIPLILLILPGYFIFRNRENSKMFPLIYWIGSISALAFFSYTPVLRHFSGVTSLYLPILPAAALLSGALLEKMKTSEKATLLLFLALFTLSQFSFFLCKMGVDPFHSGILASMNKNRVMFFSIYEKAE